MNHAFVRQISRRTSKIYEKLDEFNNFVDSYREDWLGLSSLLEDIKPVVFDLVDNYMKFITQLQLSLVATVGTHSIL